MNWKKILIKITAVNVLGWILLEIWARRYSGTNVETGSAFLIILHLISYYVLVIGSNVPQATLKPDKIEPHNCPGHDWQPHKYSDNQEQCVKCGAERGRVQAR